MNRSRRYPAGFAALTLVALLAGILNPAPSTAQGSAAVPDSSDPVREVAMPTDAIPSTVDPALAAWRGQVLPAIRDFLAAERTDSPPWPRPKSRQIGAGQRAAAARLEERKLRGEHRVLSLQADWARQWGRQELAQRLLVRLQALEAACPALAEAASEAGGTAEVAR
ncbi:MAG: hypothetical protein IPI48_17880 [bacterium]|nr:hypothetical protein [bacterium]